MKNFTKAAIRSQPSDLLQWSAAYFKALANKDVLPVKSTFEDVSGISHDAVTKGKLQVLHNQISSGDLVDKATLREKWIDIGCSEQTFNDLLLLGGFEDQLEWKKFLALACSSLASDISGALTLVCEVLTTEEGGSSCRIPYTDFKELYSFLSQIDGNIEKDHVNSVLSYLESDPVPRFDGQVGPVDFCHSSCPPLKPLS